MFLNFFSHAPLTLVIFAHAPHRCRVKTVAPPPQKELQMGPFGIYKHLGSFALFRLISCIISTDVPEISSRGARHTFVHAVSFGLCETRANLKQNKN